MALATYGIEFKLSLIGEFMISHGVEKSVREFFRFGFRFHTKFLSCTSAYSVVDLISPRV